MDTAFAEWDSYALKKTLVPRSLSLDQIVGDARLKIVAVTGIRRCGKSSVLILLRQKLRHEGKNAAYLNLEDSRIKDSPSLLDDALKWFGDSGYLLLDEITAAKDWEGWLARNHEMLKGRLHIVVSSSRAALSKPSKPLRGRVLTHELYPLSFGEFLRFQGIGVESTTVGIGRVEKALSEYLVYGGFPEVALAPDKTDKVRLLNSYFRDIVGLDVAELAKSHITAVELFGKYIVEAPYFSASKCLNFFRSVGHKIGKVALLNLEKCSQDGYLFFFVPIFSHTIKDRSQYPRKAYLGDTGFLYAMSGRSDMGRLLENVVYLELRRRLPLQNAIHYWRNQDGVEADFVIREGLGIAQVVQAAYSVVDEKTRKREVQGLAACAKEFGLKSGTIVTWDVERVEDVSGVKARFVPLWKWLLEAPKHPSRRQEGFHPL
ncbi:MAG: ATP-binding protein [Elusimicrobia bacterium]|nr:ATP-binding protein [Elusimicrobiota bacterium]